MIVQELKKLKLQEEMISISRLSANSDLTGVVEFVNDEVIILREHDDNGAYSGFSLFEIDQISEVYWGHRRHKSIAFLANKARKKKRLNIEQDTFEGVFLELVNNFSYVSIYSDRGEDRYIIGKIVEFNSGWIKLDTFGDKRTLSRTLNLIRFEDILRAEFDSPYQKDIVELHKQSL